MYGVAVGRIVNYVYEEGGLEIRPAIIVRLFAPGGGPDGVVNLQVFTDGLNDHLPDFPEGAPPVVWRTSVKYSSGREPRTWHWPSR